jgi:hypothetical protein
MNKEGRAFTASLLYFKGSPYLLSGLEGGEGVEPAEEEDEEEGVSLAGSFFSAAGFSLSTVLLFPSSAGFFILLE